MELSPKAIVAGRYRAEQRLGSGAMGEVWSAVHTSIGIKVALKRMLPAGTNNHEAVARFRREAQLLGRVNSEFVARVLDFLDDPQYGLVLVMELVEGTSLYNVLNQRRFSVEEAVELGCDILGGLCDLHEAQIVHRDLKPGNVIVEPRSRGRQRARLVDFGMSRVMHQGNDEEEMTGITRADVALGTLEYMAPEQMLNSREVTGAADVYAAGVILFRAVAGHHAYRSDSDGGLVRAKLTQDAMELPTGRSDALAKGFAAVVARAMQRKPKDRYGSAEEMLRDLERLRAPQANLWADDPTSHDRAPPAMERSFTIPEEGTPAGNAVYSQRSSLASQPTHNEESQVPIALIRTPGSARASAAPPRRGLAGWVVLATVGGMLLGAAAMHLSGLAVPGLAATPAPASASVAQSSMVVPLPRPEPVVPATEPAASASASASARPPKAPPVVTKKAAPASSDGW